MSDDNNSKDDPQSASNDGPTILPLLPLRDIVIFPESLTPLFVGRPRSVAALETAMKTQVPGAERRIILSAQRTARTEEPGPEDVYDICTIGVVKTLLLLQNNMMKVLVAGEQRARIKRFMGKDDLPGGVPDGLSTEPYIVEVERIAEPMGLSETEKEPLLTDLQRVFEEYARLSKRVQVEVPRNVAEITDPVRRADVIAGYVPLKSLDKQKLLEEMDVHKRVTRLVELVDAECDMLRMQRKVRGRFKKPSELRQQNPQQDNKGGGADNPEELQDEFKNELAELERRLDEKPLTQEARERVAREFKKLRMMSMMSAEATVVRSYLDWVAMLPWEQYSEDPIDIAQAERILDEDHYGLDKVKERILEHLAVQKLVDRMRGPILCLVGPPGVGKTSLAKSIARATGREFVRLSLGGVRDEAEIRGHRRTYIGALPGKIISSFKRAGTSNPVLLLDEIDKMSTDFRGDPAAAMLEVLDPEQNHSFVDHYLDLDYDLSKVLFICTANNLAGIQGPLQDRLEIIRLSGYTDLEKMSIARRYLVPKQLEANGLAAFEPVDKVDDKGRRIQLSGAKVEFQDGALKKILNNYTREAGVRNLEREIGTCSRKAAIELLKRVGEQAPEDAAAVEEKPAETPAVEANEERDPNKPPPLPKEAADEAKADDKTPQEDPKKKALRDKLEGETLRVNAGKVKKYLGTERFRRRDKDEADQVGVANGLAWTSVGGEVLTTEVALTPGRGKLLITGKLGDVMQESAKAALTYVRSRAQLLGLPRDFYDRIDVHIHVPEGATPKDGPSAGITLATTLVSALTKIPIKSNVAMTGEITLRGRVMAIGGLKEKALAAHRAGCDTVIMPAENEKDLADIPESVKRKLTFVPVHAVDEVLRVALAVEDADAVFADLKSGDPADPFDESDYKAPNTPGVH